MFKWGELFTGLVFSQAYVIGEHPPPLLSFSGASVSIWEKKQTSSLHCHLLDTIVTHKDFCCLLWLDLEKLHRISYNKDKKKKKMSLEFEVNWRKM